MYLQSIKSVKHNAENSVYRSILKKSRHLGFDVFIVHSSMICTLSGILRSWRRRFLSAGSMYAFWAARSLCSSEKGYTTFCVIIGRKFYEIVYVKGSVSNACIRIIRPPPNHHLDVQFLYMYRTRPVWSVQILELLCKAAFNLYRVHVLELLGRETVQEFEFFSVRAWLWPVHKQIV